MTPDTFDHLIFVTDDLAATEAAFAKAGFATIRRADAGKNPSENRLVVFEDGSYLEILSFVDPEYGARHQLRPLLDAVGPAWGDWSLLVADMDAWVARLKAADVPHVAAPDYAKTLADGRDWSLRLTKTGRGVKHPELPFLIQDNTPHALRVPDAQTVHPCGATGIAGITLVTADIAATAPALDVLMAGAADIPAPEGAAAARRWTFGPRFVELVEPAPGSALAARLDAAGPVITAVHLAGPEAAALPFDIRLGADAPAA